MPLTGIRITQLVNEYFANIESIKKSDVVNFAISLSSETEAALCEELTTKQNTALNRFPIN